MRESEYTANRALATRTDRIERRAIVERAHRPADQMSLVCRAAWMLVVFVSACAIIGAYIGSYTGSYTGPSHNASGGYVEACGDLPGLVGDDC
jgi:hypothetical protein